MLAVEQVDEAVSIAQKIGRNIALRCGLSGEIDDLAQESLLRALRWQQLPVNIKASMCALLHSAAGEIRARQRRLPRRLEVGSSMLPALLCADDPVENCIAAESAERVNRALLKLQPRERAAIRSLATGSASYVAMKKRRQRAKDALLLALLATRKGR